LASYLLGVATLKLVILGPGRAVNVDDADRVAIAVVVPLAATFTYLLAVFSYGLGGDLAARESMYPARMFTLPVTTEALVAWPMLYGSAAMAILWLATRLLAVWPTGVEIPWIWPALLAAVLLAWTQALTWMAYGLPGMRVIVAVLWLAAIDVVVIVAVHFNAGEPVMVAILAPQVPVAYVVARVAVARARRGDVPDWRAVFVRLWRIADLSRQQQPFPSPAHAQRWFEWQRSGRSLPALVGIVLPFELALLFAADNNTPALVWLILLGALLTPSFMAAFAAATARTSNTVVTDAYGVTPLVATRPLTSAALAGAKLQMAIRSTLAAWLLVLAAIPLALTLSGTWPVVIERVRHGIELVGPRRAVVFALLVFSGLWLSTWRQLLVNLYVGLSGRAWLTKASVFLALSFLTLIGPIVQWIIDDSSARGALWDALPWLIAILVGVRMSVAAWIVTRLYSTRLLSDRILVTGAACWLVLVFALYGLLGWLVSGPLIPRYFLVLVSILAIPLVRPSAAPLALAWNRHR
jgi:hypothetical protein